MMRPYDVKEGICVNCGTPVEWCNWHYPICWECGNRHKEHTTMRCFCCGNEMLIAERKHKRINYIERNVCANCYEDEKTL